MTRDCKIEFFKPYYNVKYGVKNILKQDGNGEYFDYDNESESIHWDGFNGLDFCSKIVADCVQIQADSEAIAKPGDFQNCKKLIIEANSSYDYSYNYEGREVYEYDLELIEKLNHPNVHLHLSDSFQIVDHPGKHDGARVWRMDDVKKFLERLVSFLHTIRGPINRSPYFCHFWKNVC